MKIKTRDFVIGDKVIRKDGSPQNTGWVLPEGTILTIKKISEDKNILWFEENCSLGEEDPFYQFWRAGNFQLYKSKENLEND